ncbi:BrnT family toxin [Candidatus Gottesmanbacteria bacterium]|nr:BrnT family toxin [Candidatus Gottesmanbacteria bacterium]
MTRIIVKKLRWQEWNIKHIKKHHVSVTESEDAAKHLIAHKRGYKGRYIVIGRTGKRILAIIVCREKTGQYVVVTARDADKEERRRVYEKEKHRSDSTF